MSGDSECEVCGGRHNDQIHKATVSIHRWLRLRTLRCLQPVPVPRLRTWQKRGGEVTITPSVRRNQTEHCTRECTRCSVVDEFSVVMVVVLLSLIHI